MACMYRTPEGHLGPTCSSKTTAKSEAVKFALVREFAKAGMHADVNSPDPEIVDEEFAALAASGWSVLEDRK